MKWEKKGLICNASTFGVDWHKKNTMVPVPHLLNSETLRIFITMCDAENVGRIGYVDVNPDNPSEILGFSKTPVIDIGDDGTFDDNGVVTASVLKDGDCLYMYYSSYQACVKVPYLIFTGVAVSSDNGNTFTKITNRVPMLDRVVGEVSTRCVPFVIKENGIYKMWYTSDSESGWIDNGKKKLPLYDLKYSESSSPTVWPQVPGRVAVSFADANEHGIAKCTLWKDSGKYKIIYSIRSLDKGYRLGYGESDDGFNFVRLDDQIGIDVSQTGWDSEMIEFAERFEHNGKVYLFYCGNHYGLDGMGYAQLVEN